MKIDLSFNEIGYFYALVKMRIYAAYISVAAVYRMSYVALRFISCAFVQNFLLMAIFAKKITIIALKKTIYNDII